MRRGTKIFALPRSRGLVAILAGVLAAGAIAGVLTDDLRPMSVAAQEAAVPLADVPVTLGGSRTPHPPPTGQVREYELVAAPVQWEVLPDVSADALSYNGQVPGPTIRVTEGDTLRVTLTNELDEPTSIHWHGLHVPNEMDGVPPLTQEAVAPGERFTYEFTVSHAGTFMYHSHVQVVDQIGRGLYGPLIVDPQPSAEQPSAEQATTFDNEFTMMISAWTIPDATAAGDQPMAGMDDESAATAGEAETSETSDAAMAMDYNYFTINGKAFPEAPAWEVTEGDLVRVRLLNISNVVHPMHLHGQDFKVVAKDGESLRPEQQLVMNTISINAGETYDVVFLAESPGTWVFHCHELHHTENNGVEPGGLLQVIAITPDGDD